MLLVVRHKLAHPVVHRIGQAGLASECRIHLEKAVIDRPRFLVELHLYDTEAPIDRLEKRTVARLTSPECRVCNLQLLQSEPGCDLTHDRAGDVCQQLLVLDRPGTWLSVNGTESTDDAAVRNRERNRKIRHDPELFDG